MEKIDLSDDAKIRLQARIDELSAQINEDEKDEQWDSGIVDCTAMLEILPVLNSPDLITIFEQKLAFFEESQKLGMDAGQKEEYKKDYRHYSELVEKIEARKNWEQGIQYCDKILPVLVAIGKDQEFSKWWGYWDTFLENISEPAILINYIVKLSDYGEFLRQANQLESKDRPKAKLYLSYCLALLLSNEELFLKENPRKINDKLILFSRLRV